LSPARLASRKKERARRRAGQCGSETGRKRGSADGRGPAASERKIERLGALRGGRSWTREGSWAAVCWFFFLFPFAKLFQREFLNENKRIKIETHNIKINVILSINAKACCYPYGEFYSQQNNLFAKFNAHKNT